MPGFFLRTVTAASIRPSALATAESVSALSHESSSSVHRRIVPGIPNSVRLCWTTPVLLPTLRPMARSVSVPIKPVADPEVPEVALQGEWLRSAN
jgi:hypothetical protein